MLSILWLHYHSASLLRLATSQPPRWNCLVRSIILGLRIFKHLIFQYRLNITSLEDRLPSFLLAMTSLYSLTSSEPYKRLNCGAVRIYICNQLILNFTYTEF
jgi:hypothetical protein